MQVLYNRRRKIRKRNPRGGEPAEVILEYDGQKYVQLERAAEDFGDFILDMEKDMEI